MNCHVSAGTRHKVLLRRLLAAFFDRFFFLSISGSISASVSSQVRRFNIENNYFCASF